MRDEPPRRSAVIRPSASELRRTIGRTSSAIVVELAQYPAGDAVVRRVPMRDLASSDGRAKDSVGQPFRRQPTSGLVALVRTRAATCAFDHVANRLAVASTIETVQLPLPPAARSSGRCRRRRIGQLAPVREV